MTFAIEAYARCHNIHVSFAELARELEQSFALSNRDLKKGEEPALGREATIVGAIRNISRLTQSGAFEAFALSEAHIRRLVIADVSVPEDAKHSVVSRIVRELAAKIVDAVLQHLTETEEPDIPLELERQVRALLRREETPTPCDSPPSAAR